MSFKPTPGDVVTAVLGRERVLGFLMRVERDAFWIETTDGMALRFLLLAERRAPWERETSH